MKYNYANKAFSPKIVYKPAGLAHHHLNSPLGIGMIKKYKFIQEAANAVKIAAEESASAVLSQHAKIQGHEEEITAQLKYEITKEFVNRVQANLNGKVIHGVQFAAQVFSRTQESNVGADLMGVLQIDTPTGSVQKGFLAQAKVCDSGTDSWGNPIAICYDSNSRLRGQVEDMLSLTPDSFAFFYTAEGVFVVPAFQINLTSGNRISTDEIYAHRIGPFYEEHFKCFIGDQRIAPPSTSPGDLEQQSEELSEKANHVLSIQAKLPLELDF